jgi:capsular polysaccharide export protein
VGLKYSKPICVLGEAIYNIPDLVFTQGLDLFWKSGFNPKEDSVNSFLKLLATTLHVRGVYYKHSGLNNAVREACSRIINNNINEY